MVQNVYLELYSLKTPGLHYDRNEIVNIGSEEIPEIDMVELTEALLFFYVEHAAKAEA